MNAWWFLFIIGGIFDILFWRSLVKRQKLLKHRELEVEMNLTVARVVARNADRVCPRCATNALEMRTNAIDAELVP